MSAPQTQAQPPIASVGEAERAIVNLETIMERLAATIGEETARVRGGHLHQARELEAAKTELARAYTVESTRLKNGKALVGRALPDVLDALRRRRSGIPGTLAPRSNRAGDRACGIGRHHPRRIGRTRPQADAADLWRQRPRQ